MRSDDNAYGSIAIFIHWASALLIFVLLASGFRSGFADDPALKAMALRIHVPVAILVLILTVGRLIWWWRIDRKPLALPGTPNWQALVARWTHRAFYLVILLLLASGIAMSVISGLPDALFGDAVLPDFSELAPRAGHGIGARLLAALILLHVAGALYHHFVLRDRTLRRMWPGSQRPAETPGPILEK